MSPLDIAAQRAIQDAMRAARASILKLCTELAGLPHLNPVERAQIRALATIASIVPHSVLRLGAPDAIDARKIADHIEATARAADQLIEAVGIHAKQEFRDPTFDTAPFRGCVRQSVAAAISAIERVAQPAEVSE